MDKTKLKDILFSIFSAGFDAGQCRHDSLESAFERWFNALPEIDA